MFAGIANTTGGDPRQTEYLLVGRGAALSSLVTQVAAGLGCPQPDVDVDCRQLRIECLPTRRHIPRPAAGRGQKVRLSM